MSTESLSRAYKNQEPRTRTNEKHGLLGTIWWCNPVVEPFPKVGDRDWKSKVNNNGQCRSILGVLQKIQCIFYGTGVVNMALQQANLQKSGRQYRRIQNCSQECNYGLRLKGRAHWQWCRSTAHNHQTIIFILSGVAYNYWRPTQMITNWPKCSNQCCRTKSRQKKKEKNESFHFTHEKK